MVPDVTLTTEKLEMPRGSAAGHGGVAAAISARRDDLIVMDMAMMQMSVGMGMEKEMGMEMEIEADGIVKCSTFNMRMGR